MPINLKRSFNNRRVLPKNTQTGRGGEKAWAGKTLE
jgi:hypothetical protein